MRVGGPGGPGRRGPGGPGGAGGPGGPGHPAARAKYRNDVRRRDYHQDAAHPRAEVRKEIYDERH